MTAKEQKILDLQNKAENGDAQAAYELGKFYDEDDDYEDSKNAFNWYETASKMGHSLAKVEVAFCLWMNFGVEYSENNKEKALEYLKQAQAQGCKEAFLMECELTGNKNIEIPNEVESNSSAKEETVLQPVTNSTELINQNITTTQNTQAQTAQTELERLKAENELLKLQAENERLKSESKSFKRSNYSFNCWWRYDHGKQIVLSIVTVFAVIFSFIFVKKLDLKIPKNEKQKNYKVGQMGQGGVVFYDKGEYSDGWRYLECSLTGINGCFFSIDPYYIPNLKNGLGVGDFNTKLIIDECGSSCAAYKASQYDAFGYTDWYLPTRAEMEKVYKILGKKYKGKVKKIENFEKITYGFWDEDIDCWTSEMQSRDNAYYVDCSKFFGGNSTAYHVYKYTFLGMELTSTNTVRPIRKF